MENKHTTRLIKSCLLLMLFLVSWFLLSTDSSFRQCLSCFFYFAERNSRISIGLAIVSAHWLMACLILVGFIKRFSKCLPNVCRSVGFLRYFTRSMSIFIKNQVAAYTPPLTILALTFFVQLWCTEYFRCIHCFWKLRFLRNGRSQRRLNIRKLNGIRLSGKRKKNNSNILILHFTREADSKMTHSDSSNSVLTLSHQYSL